MIEVVTFGDSQTQLQGLADDNIWVVRTHEKGVQFQQPGSPSTDASFALALEFAMSIISIVRTQIERIETL